MTAGVPSGPDLSSCGVRLPDPERLFVRRAERFRALAEGHPEAPLLAFMAELADAQHVILQRCAREPIPPPDSAHVARCLERAVPPLLAAEWPRDPIWRRALSRLLEALLFVSTPELKPGIATLLLMEEEELERSAQLLLTGRRAELDPLAALFLGAGLQIYWSFLASVLPAEGVSPAGGTTGCPVCGSPPVAMVADARGEGRRHCSLCGSDWHLPHGACGHCRSGEEAHLHPAGASQVCEACRTYLKHLPHPADAVADDLASRALDPQLEAQGYRCGGVNLLVVAGR